MKWVLAFSILVNVFSSIAQSDTLETNKGHYIYSCLEFEPNIYVKQTEVSIADYFGYIYDVAKDLNASEIQKFIPKHLHDSCQFISDIFFENWLTDNQYTKDYKEKWYVQTVSEFPLYLDKESRKVFRSRIILFLEMPMTGLSIEQVSAYLAWLEIKLRERRFSGFVTETHNLTVSLVDTSVYNGLLNYTKWSLTLDSTLKHTAIGDSVNIKGCHLFNFKGSEKCPANAERVKLYNMESGPVGVNSYNPNILGFYNILGNVAEMTSIEGLAYGGHYQMFAKECLNSPVIIYDAPSELIGFRYMVKVSMK